MIELYFLILLYIILETRTVVTSNVIFCDAISLLVFRGPSNGTILYIIDIIITMRLNVIWYILSEYITES